MEVGGGDEEAVLAKKDVMAYGTTADAATAEVDANLCQCRRQTPQMERNIMTGQ